MSQVDLAQIAVELVEGLQFIVYIDIRMEGDLQTMEEMVNILLLQELVMLRITFDLHNKVLNTTYLQVDHSSFHTDNVGKHSHVATMIMEDFTDEYEVDEMEILGTARVLLYHPDNITQVTLIVHNAKGDK